MNDETQTIFERYRKTPAELSTVHIRISDDTSKKGALVAHVMKGKEHVQKIGGITLDDNGKFHIPIEFVNLAYYASGPNNLMKASRMLIDYDGKHQPQYSIMVHAKLQQVSSKLGHTKYQEVPEFLRGREIKLNLPTEADKGFRSGLFFMVNEYHDQNRYLNFHMLPGTYSLTLSDIGGHVCTNRSRLAIMLGDEGDDVLESFVTAEAALKHNILMGRDGHDTLRAGKGMSTLKGGSGDDILEIYGGGASFLSGGKDNDRMMALPLQERVCNEFSGGDGEDFFIMVPGADMFFGDVVNGQNFTDIYYMPVGHELKDETLSHRIYDFDCTSENPDCIYVQYKNTDEGAALRVKNEWIEACKNAKYSVDRTRSLREYYGGWSVTFRGQNITFEVNAYNNFARTKDKVLNPDAFDVRLVEEGFQAMMSSASISHKKLMNMGLKLSDVGVLPSKMGK